MLIVRKLHRAGLLPASFDLDAGECIAVQGPSGSGKTLLLRTLADLDPNWGEVSLDGKLREAMPAPRWRRQVVYVPSESGWWSERVGDHFSDWEETVMLIKALRLPPAARDWPVQRLSTGERQRLALVRALILRPKVLLLDEPTSGLDKEAARAVEQLIAERLDKGTGVLWATHDAVQAKRIASRCLFLEDGHVREGSP